MPLTHHREDRDLSYLAPELWPPSRQEIPKKKPWGGLSLISLGAEGIPLQIDLIEDEVLVGNEIIRSKLISPNHAKIEKFAGPMYRITDYSTNGIAINGTKAKVSRLR